MKIILGFTLGAILMNCAANAQEIGSSPIYYSGGNVGIGTTSPGALLDIFSSSTNSTYMNLTNAAAGGHIWTPFSSGGGPSPTGTFGIYDSTVGKLRLLIDTSGNIGIGTTSPQHMLHVAGTVGAEEIIVSSTGADYVFQPEYRLKPLSEVKKYIQENRHLPEIPSAAEAVERGLNLGEMQTKLLAKIEELTLHMIREDERNSRLEDENHQLRRRLERLEESGKKADRE